MMMIPGYGELTTGFGEEAYDLIQLIVSETFVLGVGLKGAHYYIYSGCLPERKECGYLGKIY